VDLHPRLLLPLLREHVAAKRCGANTCSPSRPIPGAASGPSRAATANAGRCKPFSTRLRGHKGGKQRPPTHAILPPGMNAKSLRRTFGSLLLRSGKSTAEVAAAMGNTEDVVRQHYARILGGEVDVDF